MIALKILSTFGLHVFIDAFPVHLLSSILLLLENQWNKYWLMLISAEKVELADV